MGQLNNPMTPVPTTDMHDVTTDMRDVTTDMRDVSLDDSTAALGAGDPTSPHDDSNDNGHGNQYQTQLSFNSLPPNLTLHHFTLPIRNAVSSDDGENNQLISTLLTFPIRNAVPSNNGENNQLTSTLPTLAFTAAAQTEELTTNTAPAAADTDNTPMETKPTASSNSDTDEELMSDDLDELHAPIFGYRMKIDGESSWGQQAEEIARLLCLAKSKDEIIEIMKEMLRDLNGTVPEELRDELSKLNIHISKRGWMLRFEAGQQLPGVPHSVSTPEPKVKRFHKRPMKVLGSQECRAEKQQKKKDMLNEKKAKKTRRRHKLGVRRARDSPEPQVIELDYDDI